MGVCVQEVEKHDSRCDDLIVGNLVLVARKVSRLAIRSQDVACVGILK